MRVRRRRQERRAGPGQVVVEMLLILPVFLAIVFSIMEMGYIAFQVILLNHATYEVARIGSMTRTSRDGNVRRDCSDMGAVMTRILSNAKVSCTVDETLMDDQAKVQNMDLVVTGVHDVKLVFPISNLILASRGMPGRRHLEAVVRMPIEQPLQK